MKYPLLVLLLLYALSYSATATNYYVSASGDNANDGRSSEKAFLTLQKAHGLTQPGDTVFVMNGTYASTTGPVLNVTRSGEANKYITYKPFPGHTPIITATGNAWNAVVVNGSYILIEGFELRGNNENITYEAAFQAYTDYLAGTAKPNAYFNTNGISIGGPAAESKLPHHVTIRNCRVHDFPGGGISAIQTDYVTIEGNLVYNNAWYMMYAGSGISILNPYDSDKVTTYKNIVRNNICHTNKTTVPWASLKRLSDGNGIIIDVNQYPYNDKNGPAYGGRTLVENNICYHNGGSGIHAFRADHVDILNNTAYQNGTVLPDYANIFANACTDVNIINNIMYAATGKACTSNYANTRVRYDYNIYFNGTVAGQGPNDKIIDPQFVNPSLDPAVADFTLKPNSPAINAGTDEPKLYAQRDIRGTYRPQGGKPEPGAYEFGANVITGLPEVPAPDFMVLFPNPVAETLTIRLPTALPDS